MKLLGYIPFIFVLSWNLSAQDNNNTWLTFEQLEDSLAHRPKKVLLYFYTDWCTYCRKMDKEIFPKPEVQGILNKMYYVVKFDAESTDTVTFDQQQFVNRQIGKSRTPTHDLAIIFNGGEDNLAPPLFLFLDTDFKVVHTVNHYMDSKTLQKVLLSY